MKTPNEKKRGTIATLIGERTHAKTAGCAYSAVAIYFAMVTFFALLIPTNEESQLFLYVNFLAAPVAFLCTAAWYFSYTKNSVKTFVKEQKCSPKYYLVALLLQIGLLSLGELNVLFLEFLEKLGYQSTEITLPSMEGFGFVGVLITVALLPAVMEELVFRGLFLREMKDFSLLSKALLCGVLFAIYHQNPAQTIYQFICGVCFTLVAARSGSFLPTVCSHFLNNALIVVLYKLGIDSYGAPTYAIIMSMSALCLLGSLGYLLFVDGKKEREQGTKTPKGKYKEFFLCASLGIIVFGLTWLLVLFAGI